MASLKKNVGSQNFTFSLVSTTTGLGVAGATVSVFVTKDNAAQGAGSGTVTNSGNGQYNYAPTQAETNATDVGFFFTATGCIPTNYDFHPDVVDANGLIQVDVEDWKGAAVANAAAGIPKVDVDTIKTNPVVNGGTITFPTTATLASTTNITAGTITTVSGNVNGSVGSVTGAVGSVTGAVGSVTGSVGSVTGNVGGNVVGSVASVTAPVTVGTNNDKTGYALSSGERTSIADAMLDRDMSAGTDSGAPTTRTVRQALRFLRNKWSISGSTLTVTKEDDTTASWTSALTTTAGADPITGFDPAG